jgi:hypothetical protein
MTKIIHSEFNPSSSISDMGRKLYGGEPGWLFHAKGPLLNLIYLNRPSQCQR